MKTVDKMANGIYVASAIGCVPMMIILIAIVGLVRSCVVTPVDPMDNSHLKRGHVIANFSVLDSVRNGFEVVYTTTKAVTDARRDEIASRKHIRDGFDQLKKDAPLHFGLMLDTDIYDFAEFAKRYDSDPDIKINSIFVDGKKKEDMYRRPNPLGDKFATLDEIYTEQGIQYITFSEIYYCKHETVRRYKYWQCNGDHSTSSTDERYSHVERDEITPW